VKLNIVPARTGFEWVKLGVRTFMKQPLALTGLFFMYMAVVAVLFTIPVVGPVLGVMIAPAATLGFMMATWEVTNGRFPMPTVLVSAFRADRQRAKAMLVLGVLYAVCAVVVGVLSSLVVGDLPVPQPDAQATPDAGLVARVFLSLVLYVPVLLLFWHAPALVHWYGVTPVKSMFFSVIACVRNFGAYLVYALAWGVVFLLLSLVMSMVAALVGGQAAATAVLVPTLLLLLAMFSTSLYFTFRDSFRPDEPEASEPAPGEEGGSATGERSQDSGEN
jgi:hypothetical protein